MLELSCYSNFTKEPVPADHPGQLRMEQLDGDHAVMPPISGEPDRTHPPSTQLAQQRIAVRDAADHRLGHDQLHVGGKATEYTLT